MGRKRRESLGSIGVVAVGLTGGIGAGKSTALAFFADHGAKVLSADSMVHVLYEQPEIAEALGAHFGRQVLDVSGAVDRARLAVAVRGRPDELRWLEELTHPRVRREIQDQVEAAPVGSVVVCEMPLLFESGCETLFDLVVTIEADDELRRYRSNHRFGLKQFTELEELQTSRARRVAESDMAYVNDGELQELREFVRRAYVLAQGLLEEGSSKRRK